MYVYTLCTLFILYTIHSLSDDKKKDDVTQHPITPRTNALEPVNEFGRLFVSFDNAEDILSSYFPLIFQRPLKPITATHLCCYPSLSCATVSPFCIPFYIRLFFILFIHFLIWCA